MSGEKARAINRAWERWPNVDVEAVAEMVAAGWDAHAALSPAPLSIDREALVKAIVSISEHDPDTHDFISPSKAADAVLAAVVRRYLDVDVADNNVSDSLVLAAMGSRFLGRPLETELPKVNLGAMTAIQWPNPKGTK